MTLPIDADDLASCVGCGLCLPHCPTYRVTRDELMSPRGRIAAMRQVNDHDQPITGRFIESIDTCIQCLGCETACPSAVPYGKLIAGAREGLAAQDALPTPTWLTYGLRTLRWHRLVLFGSTLAGVAQRIGVPTDRLGLPPMPLRRRALRPTGTEVYLHTGCVMDAWYRPVHQASVDVLGAMGIGVALPTSAGACCGALSEHAGDAKTANAMAERTIGAFPGDQPILVNSAGCGAALKHYGDRLGTPEARTFSARVVDLFEYIERERSRLPAVANEAVWSGSVAVQDPCHLRHVQKVHSSVHAVLGDYGTLIDINDEGLCCGAGGSFSLTHRSLATDVRQRKIDQITATTATIVASANPGCAGHLAAGGVRTCHPIELLAQALDL